MMKECTLRAEGIRVSFREKDGTFSFSAPAFELKNCRPLLKLDGEAVPPDSWRITKGTPSAIRAETSGPYGKLVLGFSLSGTGELILNLTASLKKSCGRIELDYFDNARIGCAHLLSQGVKMGGCRSILTGAGKADGFTGYYQLILTSEDGRSLRLSYPLQHDLVASFAGRTGRGRVSGFRAGMELRQYSGRRITLPPLTLRTGDGFSLIQSYADENGHGRKDFDGLTIPAWNSWDYYRWTVTEDDVLENAEFIARDPVLSKHVRRIVIDDGWQYAYGEWEANSLFPHGMKSLAKRIRKLGLEPGLWVAPTIFDLHARLVQKHPEMLAKSVGGFPAPSWEIVKRRVYLLDPTVDASQQYIRDLFEKMLGWGYTFFKLDFLGSLLFARRFADRSVTPGKLMELTIGTAYRQVAHRAKLLGCNYLFCGGDRITDLVRVGSDVLASWKNIKLNAVSIAARYWSNRKLWVNDPDFALCRCGETSDDPEMKSLHTALFLIDPDDPATVSPWYDFKLVNDDVKRPQMEVLLSLVLMAGGAVTLSDRMSRLNESGLDLARRVVSAESGEAAVPLDLFTSEIPSFWFQKLSKGYRVLMFNWQDKERELSINLKPYGIQGLEMSDFWTGKRLSLSRGGVWKAVLPPRSCLLARFDRR
ncbi:MAG: alpha-galactosidase [Lentisphaeria bacterium]|nr:alpha-galactosidase [Lentisphaeria bacterium]